MTNNKTICLYLHVHQPYRLTKLNYLELGEVNDYFNGTVPHTNKFFIDKVSKKSYIPTNKVLQKLLDKFPEFSFSLSVTGVLIEQLEKFAPKTLESFKELVKTGRVEILSETYHHSLASLYSLREFAEQVTIHRNLIKSVFGYETTAFRNTELIYSDKIAAIIHELGFKVTIAEGWDKYLEWRSSNYVYEANLEELTKSEKKILGEYRSREKPYKKLKLLLKNYKLSDDIAFRFSNKAWEEYPLTVDKFLKWVEESPGKVVNLFMDYETFGEHQWEDTGIFDFLSKLPSAAYKRGIEFKTISDAGSMKANDLISFPEITSWADMERDISAWRGNKMQEEALKMLYELEEKIGMISKGIKNKHFGNKLREEWRKLQTSDHFYYMSTKYWSDGDVHKYFSPYESPYEAFINYMNILEDFAQKLDYELKKKN